MACLTIITSL